MWIVSQISTIPVGLVLLCGFILSALVAGLVSTGLVQILKEQKFAKKTSGIVSSVVLFVLFFFVVFPNVVKIYEDTETHQSLFIQSWLTLAIVILGSNLLFGVKKRISIFSNRNNLKTIGIKESVKPKSIYLKLISATFLLSLCFLIYLVWSKI